MASQHHRRARTLVPISSGSTAADALRNTIDLGATGRGLGYDRYWFAEHHLNPGVAGTSPAVVLALVAAATRTHPARLGRRAARPPHAAVHRRGVRPARRPAPRPHRPRARPLRRPPAGDQRRRAGADRRPRPWSTAAPPNGLLIPPPFSFAHAARLAPLRAPATLLQQPGAEPPDYAEQIDDILALLAGTYRRRDGDEAHVVPGRGRRRAGLDPRQQRRRERRGRGRSAACGSPPTTTSARPPCSRRWRATGPRSSPRRTLDRPYVACPPTSWSPTTRTAARELATGYGLWVRSIRTGEGAIPFPTPERGPRATSGPTRTSPSSQTARHPVRRLARAGRRPARTLRDATGADELLVTTITHDHADRVRSYELLAEEWQRRAAQPKGVAP